MYGGGAPRRSKPEKNFGPVPEMWEVELGDGEFKRRVPHHKGKQTGAGSDWAGMEVSVWVFH